MAIATTNPTTGELVRTFDELTSEQLDEKLRRAADAFRTYRTTTYAERAALLNRAADILDADTDELARLATLEMGKTYASARAEVAKSAKGCRWYAEHGEDLMADLPHQVDVPGAKVFTRYEPIGPVLAVMPWNFPYWQVFRFAAPTLMAGNVGLLKHASSVPQCALAIEDVLVRAGFPEGAFQTLLVPSKAIEAIIDDERVRAVTLTGSEPAGQAVGARAGHNIKTSVLELGGADPFIVMPSADVAEAVSNAVASRMVNNGQSCINAKRFIVHEQVADEFERLMVERMEALVVGDPMDESTDIGPLSSVQAAEGIEQQVQDLLGTGARLLTGGKRPSGPGAFYPPTAITDIPADAPGGREEFFGPVALIFRARDADDAIRIANDSIFGLGGSAWTRDPAEQERFVNEVETGMIYINKFSESAPPVPFGGVKHSGYGRECSVFGLRSFVNAKTVWVNTG
jgi:succinate-semialdehyde dehydrogenase/glutarate-semialdehyde dehydrogenase